MIATMAAPASGVGRRTSYTGLYAFLASVTMFFAGFSSALIVRRGASEDWKPVPMPQILWLSTGILAVTSLSAERARRDLRKGQRGRFNLGWSLTTLLGLGFVAVQLRLWDQLRAAGLFVNTHPGAAFFWVGTIAHAVHVGGGLLPMLFLEYCALRYELGPGRRTAVDVTTIYWHFLGVLWLALLALFWFGGN